MHGLLKEARERSQEGVVAKRDFWRGMQEEVADA